MTRPVAITLSILGGIVLIFLVGIVISVSRVQSAQYPPPGPMPATAPVAIDVALRDFEAVLKQKAPSVLKSLNKGLSDSEISALETKHSIQLTPELRALYRWHDGSSSANTSTFDELHYFMPLKDALAERDAMKAGSSGFSVTKIVTDHRLGWMPVFSDMAGDGYYYDPKRASKPGHFFYSFAEDTTYRYFPSLGIYFRALTDFYQQGLIKVDASDGSITEDIDATEKAWDKYSATP